MNFFSRLLAPIIPPRRCDQSWIQTVSGVKFWPLNPRSHEIMTFDIAHSLSTKVRYTGHVREFYSVAQHVYEMWLHACHNKLSPVERKWMLLHDATEAYLPDVARPVKPYLWGFKRFERRIERAVAARYNLPLPVPPIVKEYDLRILATERRDLFTRPAEWRASKHCNPFSNTIIPQPWWEARSSLQRALALEGIS